MASLPKDHPSLAIHLCDRALAPILSSGPPPSSSTRTAARTANPTANQSSAPSQHQPQSSSRNGSNSDISSVNLDDSHPSQSSSLRQSSPRQNATALRSLASTALTAHSVASRLEAGYPMRMMVEFGGRGPVVLSSFLDADSIASLLPPPPPQPQPLPPSSISTTSQFPNGQQASTPPPRTGSSPAKPTITAGVSMSTVIAAVGLPESSSTTPPIPSTPTRTSMPTPTIHTPTTHAPAPVPTSKHTGSTQTATHKRADSRADMSKDTSRGRTQTRAAGGGINTAEGYQSDGAASSEQPPPTLVGVVVAPDAEHAAEARRAANKLEHLGRRFQLAWIEEYQNPQPQETPT